MGNTAVELLTSQDTVARAKYSKTRTLAYHEAGHAVMGYLNGRRVKSIWVNPRRKPYGLCEIEGWQEWLRSDQAPRPHEADVRILLAGLVSEYILGGEAYESIGLPGVVDRPGVWMGDETSGGMHPDVDEAWMLADVLGHDSSSKANLINEVFDQSEAALRRHWPAVEAMATELMKRRKLEGDQIREIIEAALQKIPA